MTPPQMLAARMQSSFGGVGNGSGEVCRRRGSGSGGGRAGPLILHYCLLYLTPSIRR